MFFEWAAAGAEIGVKAFFTLAVFLMLCGAILGFVELAVLGARWAVKGERQPWNGKRRML